MGRKIEMFQTLKGTVDTPGGKGRRGGRARFQTLKGTVDTLSVEAGGAAVFERHGFKPLKVRWTPMEEEARNFLEEVSNP